MIVFLALEHENAVATGLGFGAVPHHPFIRENREVYENKNFINSNNQFDLTTCVQITTRLLKEKNLKPVDENQKIGDIQIYASDYFAPFQMATQKLKLTDRTIGIHQYSASWKNQNKLTHWLWKRTLPMKFKIRHLIGDERYEKMKQRLSK